MIDVAIIGGGPAGSAAAMMCARAGLSAVMFERHDGAASGDGTPDEPEESVGSDSVALLRVLGVDCATASAPYSGIAIGSQVTFFLGAATTPGRHVRRSWLDAELRVVASRAGAKCLLGVEVVDVEPRSYGGFVLLTTAGPMAVRQIIDASGRRLWLARRWNLPRRKMSPPLVAWRDVIRGPAQPSPVACFVPIREGWTFLAQVAPGRTVRTFLRAARARHGAAVIRPPSSEMKAYVATWHVVRHMAGPGWFIAGDAAAALDPAAGAGIAFALNSGLAAGQAAVANAADGTSEPVVAARYDDALLGEFTTRATELAGRYHQLGISVLDGAHATEGLAYRPAVDFVR